MTTEDKVIIVTQLPTARIHVQSFAVALTSSVLQGLDESIHHSSTVPLLNDDTGIVGSITILKNSAMIWMGWGTIQQQEQHQQPPSGIPNMGQLVVAMPRIKYKGAFADACEASSSQLVGGDSEDQMLAAQMATRLSAKLGYPIFVSCQLYDATQQEWMVGLEKSTVTQRAAAVAERKVRLLLQDKDKMKALE